MNTNTYLPLFKQSSNVKEFLNLVQRYDIDRKVSTIRRDYYRLKRRTLQIEIPKVEYQYVYAKETEQFLTYFKRLKLEDMRRLNIRITERLLKSEGFTDEEINKLIVKKSSKEKIYEDKVV